MYFDLSNYWIFVAIVAAIYVAINTFAQNNIGGKGRLRAIQAEMKEVQKKMIESSKNKNEKEADLAMAQNWKLTSEMMGIQLKLAVAILAVFFVATAFVFPSFEPGKGDDAKIQLLDDGLASHCDSLSGDGVFSGCLPLSGEATAGAWAIDAYLRLEGGEQLAHNATPIFVEGGEGWQVLTAAQPAGPLDGLLGKNTRLLSFQTDKQNYTRGETVKLFASVYEKNESGAQMLKGIPGEKIEAVSDSGTFFYYDPPIPIPLINVRRIIGSGGFFIFSAFVLSMCYGILKAVYGKLAKKN